MLPCQRSRFSLPPGTHYLNCAYMSPLSRRVEEAGMVGLRRKRLPSDIGERDFFEDRDRVRALFARLVNAEAPERVAILPSVSYGIANAVRNLPVERGQNIVILGEQFPSNVLGWRGLAQHTGAKLRVVERPAAADHAAAWNAAILEAIDDDTAVVALAPVHWTDGTAFDLAAIGHRAREVGAAFVVDGTQAVGAQPFDLATLRPDALIVACYKWLLGPYGIALGYYGPRFDGGTPIEEPWIVREGSDDFQHLVHYRDEYRSAALRYDAGGSSNFITVPMTRAALEELSEWGVDRIGDYCWAMLDPVVTEAAARDWPMPSEAWRSPHILGLRLPDRIDLARLKRTLSDAKVAVALRGQAVRVSPHVYNDPEDIAALLSVLNRALNV